MLFLAGGYTHTLCPKVVKQRGPTRWESIKRKKRESSASAYKNTSLYFYDCPSGCFFSSFLGASAWKSYHVQIGWSITALLSWWLPRGFLLISVTSVRIHALTQRCGHNEAIWPQTEAETGNSTCSITRPFIFSSLLYRQIRPRAFTSGQCCAFLSGIEPIR